MAGGRPGNSLKLSVSRHFDRLGAGGTARPCNPHFQASPAPDHNELLGIGRILARRRSLFLDDHVNLREEAEAVLHMMDGLAD